MRFGGVGRLYSTAGMERLRNAHVCVVGIGGVGSWTVEALARSGVGQLTLVDLDDVCVTNVNRQLHALDGSVGRAKVEAMAERVRAINPGCVVHPVADFFTKINAETILATRFDFVVDAIDRVANKCRLIAFCRERAIPVVTCGGAGGKRDATAVRVDDLTKISHDRLMATVRKQLRRFHNFPRGDEPFGVPCVHSPEPPVFALKDGGVCPNKPPSPPHANFRLGCDSGLGTAAFVTRAFGFAAAGVVVNRLATLSGSRVTA